MKGVQMQDVREQATLNLYELSDEEVAAVLEHREALHGDLERDEQIDDPTVGMFKGPIDLARRAKEILRDDITARSGWTQKKD
jgi:hypothetical protein